MQSSHAALWSTNIPLVPEQSPQEECQAFIVAKACNYITVCAGAAKKRFPISLRCKRSAWLIKMSTIQSDTISSLEKPQDKIVVSTFAKPDISWLGRWQSLVLTLYRPAGRRCPCPEYLQLWLSQVLDSFIIIIYIIFYDTTSYCKTIWNMHSTWSYME